MNVSGMNFTCIKLLYYDKYLRRKQNPAFVTIERTHVLEQSSAYHHSYKKLSYSVSMQEARSSERGIGSRNFGHECKRNEFNLYEIAVLR